MTIGKLSGSIGGMFAPNRPGGEAFRDSLADRTTARAAQPSMNLAFGGQRDSAPNGVGLAPRQQALLNSVMQSGNLMGAGGATNAGGNANTNCPALVMPDDDGMNDTGGAADDVGAGGIVDANGR